MLPKTGPHIFTKSQLGGMTSLGYQPEVDWRRKFVYRQKKPYDLVLDYTFERVQVLSFQSDDPADYADTSFSEQEDQKVLDLGYNLAYSRLMKAIGPDAQIGSTLGEAGQAMGMMSTRARDVVNIVGFAAQGKWKPALNSLREALTKVSKKNSIHPSSFPQMRKDFGRGLKTVADFWLETWFGWIPLFKDISDAVDVLQNPYPKVKIKVNAKSAKDRAVITPLAHYGYLNQSYVQDMSWFVHKYKTWLGMTVQVENQNLFLANQMGLLNAGSVAWELTPWSFVVDWLGNVSQVIKSMTDMVGLKVTDQWTTRRTEITELQVHVQVDIFPRYSADPYPTGTGWTEVVRHNRSHAKKKTTFVRVPGISGPVLRFRLPPSVSNTRAMTAWSLVVQQASKTR